MPIKHKTNDLADLTLPLDLYYNPKVTNMPCEISVGILGELLITYWNSVRNKSLNKAVNRAVKLGMKDQKLVIENNQWVLK